jgi:hypothetical protein
MIRRRSGCASPESRSASEWRHKYLSRSRFPRFPDRPALTQPRPISFQHARLDSVFLGVPHRPLSPSGRHAGREPRAATSARHPPKVEAGPSSPYVMGSSPLGLRPSALPRVAVESCHRQARDGHRVASPGVPTLLEKKVAGRAAESSCRGPTAHSGDGLR